MFTSMGKICIKSCILVSCRKHVYFNTVGTAEKYVWHLLYLRIQHQDFFNASINHLENVHDEYVVY